MLKTAPINIRTEPRVKKEAQRIAEALGLNLSSVLDAYLRQFIRTKEVHFQLRIERPSKEHLKTIRASEEEYKKGDVYKFSDHRDALSFIDKKIKNQ